MKYKKCIKFSYARSPGCRCCGAPYAGRYTAPHDLLGFNQSEIILSPKSRNNPVNNIELMAVKF